MNCCDLGKFIGRKLIMLAMFNELGRIGSLSDRFNTVLSRYKAGTQLYQLYHPRRMDA